MTRFDLKTTLSGDFAWIETLVQNRMTPFKIIGIKTPMAGKDLLPNAILIRPLIVRDLPVEERHLYRDEPFTADVQRRIHTAIYDDVLAKMPDTISTIREELVETINMLYNVVCLYMGPWQKTTDMFSLTRSMEHPDIADACHVDIDGVEDGNIGTVESRLKTGAAHLLETLTREDLRAHNALFPFVRMGAVSPHQVPQVLMAAGTRTDVNDAMFLKPVKSSFIDGLSDIHEIAIDSNMARKSSMYNKKALPDSRYGERRQQLLNCVLETVYPGECGTELTVPFHVTERNARNLVGKFHVRDGKLLPITEENQGNLVGQTLDLRSPLVCRHTDGTCRTCGGYLTDYFPEGMNIGIEAVIQLMGPVGQLILSNKHVSATKTITYRMPETYATILKVVGTNLLFRVKCPTEKYVLGVPYADVARFSDLVHVRDDDVVNDQHFSSVTMMTIVRTDRADPVTPMTPVTSDQETTPYFSREFLIHVRDNPDCFTVKGKTAWISLKGFDKTLPLLRYLARSASMIYFNKALGEVFSNLQTEVSLPRALRTFSEFVWEKGMRVNMLHLEIILKSYLVTSETDYRIPVVTDIRNVKFGQLKALVENRSVGAMLGYQGMDQWLNIPRTYTVPKRTGLFDEISMLD